MLLLIACAPFGGENGATVSTGPDEVAYPVSDSQWTKVELGENAACGEPLEFPGEVWCWSQDFIVQDGAEQMLRGVDAWDLQAMSNQDGGGLPQRRFVLCYVVGTEAFCFERGYEDRTDVKSSGLVGPVAAGFGASTGGGFLTLDGNLWWNGWELDVGVPFVDVGYFSNISDLVGLTSDGRLYAGVDPPYGRVTADPVEFVDLDAFEDLFCALTVNGAIRCFGSNYFGDYEGLDREGPYLSFGVGFGGVCAVREDTTLECWGDFWDDAEMGEVPTSSGWKSVSVGAHDICAIRLDDRMSCWGRCFGTCDIPEWP